MPSHATPLRNKAQECREEATHIVGGQPELDLSEPAYQGALLRLALYEIGAAIVAVLETIEANQRRPQ
jgi:hypothetical protein